MLSNGRGVERAVKESGIRRNLKEDLPNQKNESDKMATNNAKLGSSAVTSIKSNNGGGVKRSGSDSTRQEVDADKKVPKWFKPGKPNPQ